MADNIKYENGTIIYSPGSIHHFHVSTIYDKG